MTWLTSDLRPSVLLRAGFRAAFPFMASLPSDARLSRSRSPPFASQPTNGGENTAAREGEAMLSIRKPATHT